MPPSLCGDSYLVLYNMFTGTLLFSGLEPAPSLRRSTAAALVVVCLQTPLSSADRVLFLFLFLFCFFVFLFAFFIFLHTRDVALLT